MVSPDSRSCQLGQWESISNTYIQQIVVLASEPVGEVALFSMQNIYQIIYYDLSVDLVIFDLRLPYQIKGTDIPRGCVS